jgi:hypothetical protein
MRRANLGVKTNEDPPGVRESRKGNESEGEKEREIITCNKKSERG